MGAVPKNVNGVFDACPVSPTVTAEVAILPTGTVIVARSAGTLTSLDVAVS